MNRLLRTSLTACLILMSAQSLSAEEQVPKQVGKVYADVKSLILEYYPKAEISEKDGRIEARFNTRKFMIHYPLKTGEWQDAVPTEGPNRKGLLCTVRYDKGPWMGAAMVPQTFEYAYFSTLMNCPHDSKSDIHLEAHLSYPRETSPQFLTRYSKLIQGFGNE